MNSNSSNPNSLYSREECPHCHYTFVAGFDKSNIRTCPSCHLAFKSGDKPTHLGCSICENRKRGANNIHYNAGCPALMSDGRFITYYGSTNELTEAISKLNGFDNSNKFREFMLANGDRFIKAERDHIQKEYTCNPNTGCSEGWVKNYVKNKGKWM
jgi:hypothetical protein